MNFKLIVPKGRAIKRCKNKKEFPWLDSPKKLKDKITQMYFPDTKGAITYETYEL